MGKNILRIFESKNVTIKDRRKLADILARYCYEKDQSLNVKELREISIDISETLEGEMADIYVHSKQTKGLLYHAYHNYKKALSKSKSGPSSGKKRKIKETPVEERQEKEKNKEEPIEEFYVVKVME